MFLRFPYVKCVKMCEFRWNWKQAFLVLVALAAARSVSVQHQIIAFSLPSRRSYGGSGLSSDWTTNGTDGERQI